MSNPEDPDDLVALGVRHVHVNIKLGSLFLPDDAPDPPAEFMRRVGEARVRFDPEAIRDWDTHLKRMTGDGINVVAVILNPIADARGKGLIHPDTNLKNAPFKLGAFNLTTARAVASYVGALGFLAERYSRPDKRYGLIGGYIIGNEVDSHWTWHNLGEADLDTVARQYILELRLAWLAVRQHSASPRVFASLTHSWARPNSRSPLRNTSGKALLDRLTELSRAGGDFGWDVAYHPYPENLFEPRFWNDRLAMFGYDTPMITFKNIELLPAYLRRPEMLAPGGEPRRVILSEQGLHTPEDTPGGPDGETVQAAAFALAQHRIEQTPGIDAFILHRHVDALGEGGLWLGLRHPPTPGTGHPTMGAKKKSWDTFRAAETPAFASEAAFALKLAGYEDWADAAPRPGPFPDHAPEWDSFQKRDDAVYDLIARIDDATIDHTLAAGLRLVTLPDGGAAESLYLHPLGADEPSATATYPVTLPDQPTRLVFQTYLQKSQSTGVVFRVRVDGEQLFERAVTDQTMRDGSVDLSDSAGQSISLTLEVACGKNNAHDQAHFLSPAITTLSPTP